MKKLIVIGGGLAGSEAAWQAAQRGIDVDLYEMRPGKNTTAHITGDLAELVCSNSLGSLLIDRASGLLKEELRRADSLLLECARLTALPAGSALAVDRRTFSQMITARLENHPKILIIRQEMPEIPDAPAIIASGPLTSDNLAKSILNLTGQNSLYFFDAIAPIITADSIDMNIAFRASRYDRNEENEGDYINCPLDKQQYEAFIDRLVNARRIELKEFEMSINEGVKAGAVFEGCLPVEILARRGRDALAYGPMRPVGLFNPHTGRRPYAVVQLRQDNLAGSLFNLVGFQTNLTFTEQQSVFRLIPGLKRAEFVRFGQMHRNTYINAPQLLIPTMQLCSHPHLFFAGQITGVEGYMGNIATGMVAGINAARFLQNQAQIQFPQTTMTGALCHYITHASLEDFQPMKANFGILPPLENPPKGKRSRATAYSQRALAEWLSFYP